MTPEYQLLATLYKYPFGAVVTHDTPYLVQNWHDWLARNGFIEVISEAHDPHNFLIHRTYWLTDWGKHVAWQMATGHYCGTCYWWQQRCTMPVTPSTVNCGDTKWHQLCEQWDAKD